MGKKRVRTRADVADNTRLHRSAQGALVNSALLKRKITSGLARLRIAQKALSAGGRTAWLGVKESLTLAPVEAPANAAAVSPHTFRAEEATAFALKLAELVAYPPPRIRPRKPKPRRVVMFATSQLRVDPRIEREARALTEAGFEVVVVGPDISDPPSAEIPLDWGPGVTFDLLPGGTVSFIVGAPWFYSAPMARKGAAHDAFAFHAHDLWTTLIALDCAARTGALAVLDFHEWSSENVTWDAAAQRWAAHSPETSEAFRSLENLGMRMAALTITVNQTIATALEEAAELAPGSVAVVRNVPELKAVPTRIYPPLKQQLGLPEDAFVVLYQGGTGPSRGLEAVIEGLAHAPGATLVIRGPSLDLFGDSYRALAEKHGAADRLILAPPVPSRDVVAAARGADAGLWSLPDIARNFRYALPNKVFEYLAAGLPLLVAGYPEVVKIIDGHDCGLAFDPHDPRSIGTAIAAMQTDAERRTRMRENAPVALAALDGATEWRRFAGLYEKLWAQAAGS